MVQFCSKQQSFSEAVSELQRQKGSRNSQPFVEQPFTEELHPQGVLRPAWSARAASGGVAVRGLESLGTGVA